MNGAGNPLDIWPAAASASAVESDYLILAFTLVILFLTVPIFLAITYFAFKYRQGVRANREHSEERSVAIELSWMIIPFVLTLFFFFWGARMFIAHKTVPTGALQVDAIGRQWMWKFQHPGGQSEINDLHVPSGQNVVLHMISQDVIHALYIPALRIQMDVLPDRYTTMWFKADKPGTYHLFCSEYCGTDHSVMGGLADHHVALRLRELAQSLGVGHDLGVGRGVAVPVLRLLRLPPEPVDRPGAFAGGPLRQARAARSRRHGRRPTTATSATRS